MPTKMPTKTLSFDDDGDLLLRLHLAKRKGFVDMTVSSKHLMLASPVFKAMFRPNGFQEGESLRSRDLTVVDLPDDDPEAFEILMNILHGQSRKVPDQVTLTRLREVTVLADKYQILDPLHIYVKQWLPELREQLPTTYTNDTDIFAWLTISWVFKLEDEFKSITRIAQLGSVSRLDTGSLALPIPEQLLGKPIPASL